MKITAPHIAARDDQEYDTGHGKLSARLDLRQPGDLETLRGLVRAADVFSQGYRPGTLGSRGLSPEELARLRPGLVYVSLCAAMVALSRRTQEGGSWLVRISLAQTGKWLVDRGEVPATSLKDVAAEIPPADIDRWSIESDTPVGRLRHLGPTVRLSETASRWARPSVPLGYNEPTWPAPRRGEGAHPPGRVAATSGNGGR